MGIMVRFLIRSAMENKFRTFIILFSVCLSGALLFASMAMTGTLQKMTMDGVRSQYGAADIQITATASADDPLVTIQKTGEPDGRMAFLTGIYSAQGTAQDPENRNKKFTLRVDGINAEDLQRMIPVKLLEGSWQDYKGYAVVLGQADAQKLQTVLGQMITLRINEKDVKFKVTGIAESSGALKPSSASIRVLVPAEHLQKISGAVGRYTHILIGAKNRDDIVPLAEALKEQYTQYDIREVITQEELERSAGETATSLYIMLSLVVVMGVFIIYTAFKVIAYEKLPVIGTLRSVGATKRGTDYILFGESLVYGVVGGAAGVLLGLVILNVFAGMLSENPYGEGALTVVLVYGPVQMITAFVFSVVLALVGSAVPIFSVSKLSVKDIILNQIESRQEKKPATWTGAVLILVSIALASFVKGEAGILADIVALAGVCVGLVKLIPTFSDLSVTMLHKPYQKLFGNIGGIAARNVKGNRNIINSMTLLALGLSGIIMINTISTSFTKVMLNIFSNAHYDIELFYPKLDRDYEARIKAVEGVSDTYGSYGAGDVPLVGKDYTVRSVSGLEPQYFDFWQVPLVGDRDKMFKALENDRAAIVSLAMRDQLNLKEGEVITLDLGTGTREYTIVGFANVMENEGSIIFLSKKFMKLDFKARYLNSIMIRTSEDPNIVKKRLEEKFARDKATVITLDEMMNEQINGESQLFTVLKVFSGLTMIIGIFGILNNFVVSMMSRRRQFAVMRSVGLSKDQMVRMIFAEAVFSGATGGLAGCLGGFLFVIISGYILRSMNIDMPLTNSLVDYGGGLIAAVVLSVAACVGPAMDSTKQNIVESIKFE